MQQLPGTDYYIHIYDGEELLPQAKELSELCHRAFKEHADQGINFGMNDITPEQFSNKLIGIKHTKVVCILDKDKIIGFWIMFLKDNIKKAIASIFALEPSYKGQHMGTALAKEFFQHLAEYDMDYLWIDTSLRVPYLIKMYKRFGFRGYRITHYKGRNYKSIVMRKTLHKRYDWGKYKQMWKYTSTYVWIHSIYDTYGQPTWLGRLLRKKH